MTGAALSLEQVHAARGVISVHSKSFSLASTLLPASVRDDAVVLYAYCRRADDAVDLTLPGEQPHALLVLRREIDAIYAGETLRDPLLAAFQSVVQRRDIPRTYPEELLLGMEMDVCGQSYASLADLLRYGYRVAGTVGLMMCHVMGVRDEVALAHAAHLGIGMQLTNIARDVAEDWQRGRLYLPDELLGTASARELRAWLGRPFPHHAAPAVARATAQLLELAEHYYASGDAGLVHLSARCALAVRCARLVYSAIGVELRAQHCDPLAGRAHVSSPKKLALVARSALLTLAALPRSFRKPAPAVPVTCFENRLEALRLVAGS